MKVLLVLTGACALAQTASATDHGPVFGYATPVNAQRELSCDTGFFGRHSASGTQVSTGTGCFYGLTPHLTLYASLPATFGKTALPESRIFPTGEWSAGASWRFLHRVPSVGKRLESTASLGIVVPGPQPDAGPLAGLHRAPGVAATLATGLVSRGQYAWAGVGYTNFAAASGSRRPDVFSWSAVYGYRPAKLRRGYNQWDYRGFAEFTGEHTGALRTRGLLLLHSAATTLWLGPSVLAIFKNVAIEGGVQAPLYRDTADALYGREHLRFALNFSGLHYTSNTSSH